MIKILKVLSGFFCLTYFVFYAYTKCFYNISQICELIYYQDDEKKCYIAIVMELFFEKVLMKKNEQIELICSCI